jgi:hypothetical protein
MADLSSLFEFFEKRLERRKRERRIRRALTFPMLDGHIVHAVPALTKDLRFEIQLSYRFEVSGEGAFGSAFSEPIDSENYAHVLASQIPHGAQIEVRYNPADPFENYALAADNPADLKGLPFHLAD